MRKHVSTVLLALLTAALAIPSGCATNPATGRKIPMLISTQEEIALGEEVAPEFEKEFGGLVEDEDLQRYIRDVGGRVAAPAEREMPYEFGLLRSEIPNAFALPGGNVYITVGLLEVMNSERELAAVLGHEVGHIAAQHNVQSLQRQVGAAILIEVAMHVIGGESGQVIGDVASIVTGMTHLSYSRRDEYEADLLGIRYMAAAGYNPWGMVELLKTLEEVGGEGDRLSEMFSTHPLTSKRIEEAEQLVMENHPDARRDEAPRHNERFLEVREQAVKHKASK